MKPAAPALILAGAAPRHGYSRGMRSLPDISQVRHPYTIKVSDQLSITFVLCLIPGDELEQIRASARAERFRIDTEAFDAAIAAHEADSSKPEPTPPEPGVALMVDIKRDCLVAGVAEFYDTIQSKPREFTAEDADALIATYPDFVHEGLFRSVYTWATQGAMVDPFSEQMRSVIYGRPTPANAR